jgi:hypothetical protein
VYLYLGIQDWEKDFRPNKRGTSRAATSGKGKSEDEISEEDKQFYNQLANTAPWDKIW